jgi:hypothetical protein
MFQCSNFDDIACVVTGITTANPAMVARIRTQSEQLGSYDIAAHLANAIASANDAAHARNWEESQFGEASAETLVDTEYYEELVAAWSLVASERQVAGFDSLLGEAVVH